MDSINSIDDVDDLLELDNIHVGKGRSYQCVFCKRGFTTAQALGGHMNIHRKDRAKTSTSTSTRPSTTKQEESNNFTGPRFFQPISSYTPWYAAAQGAQIHYRTFFPASTSSIHDQNLLRTIPFGEDCCMSLSLQFGTEKFGEEMEKKRRSESEDDGSLDLELRLGHDP